MRACVCAYLFVCWTRESESTGAFWKHQAQSALICSGTPRNSAYCSAQWRSGTRPLISGVSTQQLRVCAPACCLLKNAPLSAQNANTPPHRPRYKTIKPRRPVFNFLGFLLAQTADREELFNFSVRSKTNPETCSSYQYSTFFFSSLRNGVKC